jgi:hypothetical protein
MSVAAHLRAGFTVERAFQNEMRSSWKGLPGRCHLVWYLPC